MDRQATIFVAGSDTLIGAALRHYLIQQGFQTVLGGRGQEPELTHAEEVERFFANARPEYVFVAAGESGGIAANQAYPADLMRNNLLVGTHLIAAAHRHQVRKLLYLASSCCYPRLCSQPMQVSDLWTGPLEPTNEAYATAKLAAIQLCRAYRAQYGAPFLCAIPANPYGPGDSLELEDTHVTVALLARMHRAKVEGHASVEIWGTGAPRREFLYVNDLAEACVLLMDRYDSDLPINIGAGQDVSIRELAELTAQIVGFRGELHFNSQRPDGMPLKALDGTALAQLGWTAKTSLRQGLMNTYHWMVEIALAGSQV